MEYTELFLIWRIFMTRKRNAKVQRDFPKRIYFVICEDEKSMLYYLRGLKEDLPPNVVLHADHAQHTSIKKIQKEVKDKVKELTRSQAYGNFKVFACFDKDNNNIQLIKSIISDNQKSPLRGTIYNSPCYEYWLLLHTEKTNRDFSSSHECAEYCRRKINKKYSETFEDIDELKKYEGIYNLVKSDLPKAIKNAEEYGFSELENTCTNMHDFIKEIKVE